MRLFKDIKNFVAVLLLKVSPVESLFSLMGLLAGRGRWHWVSYKKPVTSLNKDILDCQHRASEQFPPNAYHKTAIDYGAMMYNAYGQYLAQQDSRPESYDTNTNCNAFGNSLNCHSRTITRPSYSTPTLRMSERMLVTADANRDVRNQAFLKCMADSSWDLEYRNAF